MGLMRFEYELKGLRVWGFWGLGESFERRCVVLGLSGFRSARALGMKVF